MHFGRMKSLRGMTRVAVALAILAMVVAATPARAAGDEDTKGWFLTLDAALTQPNDLVQQQTNRTDSSFEDQFFTIIVNSTSTLVFDSDPDFTGAIKFGYAFGNGLGKLQVSFWGFDDTISGSGFTDDYIYYNVYGYSFAYTYQGATQAKINVKASTFDVDYLRSYAVGKKTTVTWLAGLRSATYEETRDSLGTLEAYGYYPYVYETETIQAHKHFKADALGLRLGAAVKFGFTEHFGLEGSGTYSFLQAKTQGDSSALTEFSVRPRRNLETRSGVDDNVRGEMREYDLKACWSYGMMDYFVGYRMESWEGLVVDPLVATPANPFDRSRDTISFNSLHAGVTFKFGQH